MYSSQSSNCCPICSEELELDQIAFFESCNHGFCNSCMRELVLHEEYPSIECPLDHIHSDQILHYNHPRNKHGSRQYFFINESIHDYLKHAIEAEPSFFTNGMSDKVSEFVIFFHEAIEFFTTKLHIFKTTLEQVKEIIADCHIVADDDCRKKTAVYNQIEALNTKLNEKIDHLEIHCTKVDKYDILFEFIGDRTQSGKPLFNIDSLICILLQQYVSVLKDFISDHFRCFNDPAIFTCVFYKNAIHAVDKELGTMKDLSLFLTMLSVSHLTVDQRHLYKVLQPQIKDINHKTCLICTKKIHGDHYGRFVKCQHKLCITCVKTLWIFEAHCPLEEEESLETNDLEIITGVSGGTKVNSLFHHQHSTYPLKCENPFTYLIGKFEKYSVRDFDEIFQYIIEKIREIQSVLPESLDLLVDLQTLIEEDSKSHPDLELINRARLDMTHILRVTENKKFRYNDSMSMMKFYSLLACYRIMDSKCDSCHGFEAVLEDRIEELSITLEELVPYKKWLTNFEHLVDAVCSFVNKDDVHGHIGDLKTVVEDLVDTFEVLFNDNNDPEQEHKSFVTESHNCHLLSAYIEAKRHLDKKFEKHKSTFQLIHIRDCD